ncbi:hypothetical protein JYU34_005888 [Plutella xylostella]|uniref:Uncharacterized protein n=1 Tax=Plutella xylostella TaxID=51655 RepID=A0ABQ7QUD7_PLUXY|nr:hypothetical protein JYU34_005888 [Plutella xylostella]
MRARVVCQVRALCKWKSALTARWLADGQPVPATSRSADPRERRAGAIALGARTLGHWGTGLLLRGTWHCAECTRVAAGSR